MSQDVKKDESPEAPGTVKQPPRHAPQRAFSSDGDQLLIAGRTVRELLERSGNRPFYAYDSSVMTATAQRLRALLPERISLHYAMKANPMPEVVQHMATLTRGLDVASAAELRTALATGINPRDISFAGPGKSAEDLESAVDAGVIIVIESATEAHRIGALARERDIKAPVALRINPDFQLRASGMKMGGGAQPFGIDAEQAPEVLRRLRDEPLDVLGFHIFWGSQNLRAEAIIEAQEKTLELAEKLSASLPGPLRWLNIGGGLGVPYFPGEQYLDPAPIMEALATRLAQYAELLADTEVVMELGRYLVAESGVYICLISDKKVSRGTTFLVTNGGLHHHLALSGNFGQVIRKNYPVAIANRMRGHGNDAEMETVTIVGPLCTPLDLLGQQMPLPRAEIGDVVAVFMSGAYGFSASPHHFLSHPHPLEYLL